MKPIMKGERKGEMMKPIVQMLSCHDRGQGERARYYVNTDLSGLEVEREQVGNDVETLTFRGISYPKSENRVQCAHGNLRTRPVGTH